MKIATLSALVTIPALLGLAVAWSQPVPTSKACVADIETRDKVRVLMISGIDQAMQHHVVKLFEVWMKDASEQPHRATVGMHLGVSAYNRARAAVLKWEPPLCP